MFTLRQLEYLVTLADAGSFVQAARVIRVSQPTLSRQIRTLEERLNTKLIDRTMDGAILTPIGRSIVARARHVLREVQEIKTLAAGSAQGMTGTLRLGTTPTLGPYLLSPIIAELHRAAPGLRLYIREGIPDRQALELSRGELDALLGPLPIAGDDLVVEPLFREPLYLVSAVDTDLAGQATVEPFALAGRTLLSLDTRHHLYRQAAGIAAHYGMILSRDYEGTSLESLHQMVASGSGLSLLPGLYLASDVGGATGLAVLNVTGWNARRSVAVARRKASSLNQAFSLIADHVQRAANRMLDQ